MSQKSVVASTEVPSGTMKKLGRTNTIDPASTADTPATVTTSPEDPSGARDNETAAAAGSSKTPAASNTEAPAPEGGSAAGGGT